MWFQSQLVFFQNEVKNKNKTCFWQKKTLTTIHVLPPSNLTYLIFYCMWVYEFDSENEKNIKSLILKNLIENSIDLKKADRDRKIWAGNVCRRVCVWKRERGIEVERSSSNLFLFVF